MRKLLPLVLFILFGAGMSAQYHHPAFLQKRRNLPHAGDSIIKQQMQYIDSGASGHDIDWDFSNAKPVDDAYNLLYKTITRDTLNFIGIEHRTIYRYKVKGDTLLHTGYENATTLMNYTRPEIKMKFPFHYGDTISSHFEGKGEYCHKLPFHVSGNTVIQADATGTLTTPDNKVYKNVLRVKSLRQYTQTGVDSVSMTLETYSWYVKGNRYPVFETVKTTTQKTGKEEIEHKVASFFYPPKYQILQTDTAGLAEKETKAEALTEIDHILTTCRLLPNPVDSQLCIEYELAEDATISFSVHNSMGIAEITTSPAHREQGFYTEILQMGSLPKGIYPLYVTVNGMVKTLHVVKK